MSAYNGWTNYATWRVNLEMLDGINASDFWEMDRADIKDVLPEQLENHVLSRLEDEMGGDSSNSFCFDYARCFLADVDWHEIAQHIIDDYVSANLQA